MKVPKEDVTFNVEVADVFVDDNVRLVEERVVMARPAGALALRLIVPENPPEPVMVTVDRPIDPELIVSDPGLVVTLKPGDWTATETSMECEVEGPLAVTVTV